MELTIAVTKATKLSVNSSAGSSSSNANPMVVVYTIPGNAMETPTVKMVAMRILLFVVSIFLDLLIIYVSYCSLYNIRLLLIFLM